MQVAVGKKKNVAMSLLLLVNEIQEDNWEHSHDQANQKMSSERRRKKVWCWSRNCQRLALLPAKRQQQTISHQFHNLTD